MKNYNYQVVLDWSDEDKVFVARVPELDGVVTHGRTPKEAVEMAEEAVELHLESLRAHKEAIPKPISLDKLSGKYPLRMSKELHKQLLIEARNEAISVNELLNTILEKYVQKKNRSSA